MRVKQYASARTRADPAKPTKLESVPCPMEDGTTAAKDHLDRSKAALIVDSDTHQSRKILSYLLDLGSFSVESTTLCP